MSAYLRPRRPGATILGAAAPRDRGSTVPVDKVDRLRRAVQATRAKPRRRSRSRTERGRAGRRPAVLTAQPGEARVGPDAGGVAVVVGPPRSRAWRDGSAVGCVVPTHHAAPAGRAPVAATAPVGCVISRTTDVRGRSGCLRRSADGDGA